MNPSSLYSNLVLRVARGIKAEVMFASLLSGGNEYLFETVDGRSALADDMFVVLGVDGNLNKLRVVHQVLGLLLNLQTSIYR